MSHVMFYNYFKIAIRSLWRNRQFSIINIAGLALGLVVFLFIMQYVAFEWSSNRFHKHYNELYRVNVAHKEGITDYYLSAGFAPIVKDKIAGIENYVRVADGIGNGIISATGAAQSKVFKENGMSYVDGNFLSVFTFPLVSGSPSLKEPKTLALSEGMSLKIFGSANTAGKNVIISNQFGKTTYTVAAVYKDMPEQSDIKANVLLSLATLESAANRDGNDWADPNGIESGFTNIYLQLSRGVDASKIANEITSFIHSIEPKPSEDKINLQPFNQLHLAPSFNYPFQTFGNLLLVTVFSCVAVLILLIAWINYINLSTAQALTRAREVGVRKVLGAKRMQLVLQYLSETFLVTISAVLVAFVIVQILQPFFNNFIGHHLSLVILNNSLFWLFGAALILTGSLLSGGYVALVLSAYNPLKTIRNKIGSYERKFSLRKGLVVFQFSISIIFIIATFVLYRQLQFMKTKDLGMNLSQLLVITGPTVSSEKQAEENFAFKNEVAQLPFVEKFAASNNIPGQGYNFSTEEITRQNPQKNDDKKSYSMFISDEHFFDTYGIQFVEGKPFSVEDATRSWNNIQKVIINEKATSTLGFKKDEKIAGQKILWNQRTFEVIGVVKDYNHLSLREAIKPTIYLASVSFGFFTIKTRSQNIQSKINTLRLLYNKHFPGNPFDYFFADEQYNKQYIADQKLGNVFIAAACIAILIACMGLFGLATFSASQRIKEIGIRKVLGAGVADITTLISKDFIRLVIIALLVASPIAWFTMHKWLENFAYRTEINWWIFVSAGFVAVLIAVATISFQAIKAATANPVISLRSE
jgi:putative ABC transport system permease protein